MWDRIISESLFKSLPDWIQYFVLVILWGVVLVFVGLFLPQYLAAFLWGSLVVAAYFGVLGALAHFLPLAGMALFGVAAIAASAHYAIIFNSCNMSIARPDVIGVCAYTQTQLDIATALLLGAWFGLFVLVGGWYANR